MVRLDSATIVVGTFWEDRRNGPPIGFVQAIEHEADTVTVHISGPNGPASVVIPWSRVVLAVVKP